MPTFIEILAHIGPWAAAQVLVFTAAGIALEALRSLWSSPADPVLAMR